MASVLFDDENVNFFLYVIIFCSCIWKCLVRVAGKVFIADGDRGGFAVLAGTTVYEL